MKQEKGMDGQLLDVGNDRFRATYLMKHTRAAVGWALTMNPDEEWLRNEERHLVRDYRSAKGYVGRDEMMCLAAHLILGERFISEPESLAADGVGLDPISRSELREALSTVRTFYKLLPDDDDTTDD